MTELVLPSEGDELAWLEDLITAKSYYNHYTLDGQVFGVKFLRACLAFTKSGKQVPLSSITLERCTFQGSPDVFFNIFHHDGQTEIVLVNCQWPEAVVWGKSLAAAKRVRFQNNPMDITPLLEQISHVGDGAAIRSITLHGGPLLFNTELVLPTIKKVEISHNDSLVTFLGYFPNLVDIRMQGIIQVNNGFAELMRRLNLTNLWIRTHNISPIVEVLPVYPEMRVLQLQQVVLGEAALVSLEQYLSKYRDHPRIIAIGCLGDWNGPRKRVMDFYCRLQFMPFNIMHMIHIHSDLPGLESNQNDYNDTKKINARYEANRQFVRRLALMGRLATTPDTRELMYLMEVGKWNID
jgi:hypothetical protein